MQRYQTEDERRKAMRAKINKTIKRGRRRKRIIRRLRKAVPGICIGVLIAGMGAWCIAAPLPDPDDYEPYQFQAENGQWYTQEEYEQMSRERDAYHQREREEAEKEAQMIRDYQEQYQKDQEAEWKLYQEQMRTGLIHSMDFDANDAYLLEKIAMAEAESEDTEGKALVMLVVLNRVWDARFPDTIEEVIMQDGVFTPVSNGRCWMRKPSYQPSTQCDESTMAFRRRPETSQSRDSGQISVYITHSFAFSNRSFCIAPIRSAADAYREKERTEQRPRSRSGSGRIRSIPSTF